MITKDQANTIAESLLDQQQKILLQAKNAKARRIPFYFRSPELVSLEPWQQTKVVRKAAKDVVRQWRFKISMVAWFAVCFAFWYFAFPAASKVSLVLFLLVAAAIPQFMVQCWLVRREIQSIIRSRQFSA